MTPPWFWTAWAFALAGFAGLATVPQALVTGFGHVALPALVHAFTLGAVLTAYYGVSFGTAPDGAAGRTARALAWAVWGLHVAGTLLTLWGFWRQVPGAAHLGGHYLLPAAVAIVAVRELVGAFRSPVREPWRAAPALGLLLTMGLGVMLLLDRFQGGYGTYTPQTVALHGLAAAFLFLLPAQSAGGWATERVRDEGTVERGATLLRAGLGALGLLALALGGQGMAHGWTAGLGLLALVALWTGLPDPARLAADPPAALRRLPWAAVGVLLAWAALQHLRGGMAAGPAGAYGLGGLIGTAGVLGAALPDWLWRLAHAGPAGVPSSGLRWFAPALAAALLVGLGHAWSAELWVQAGGFTGLVALGVLARPLMGRVRPVG